MISIQVRGCAGIGWDGDLAELGWGGGGFLRNSEARCKKTQMNANQPFKCKAVSSLLAAHAIRTNQLMPSHLTL